MFHDSNLILDLRTSEEFEWQNLPGSFNIPADDFDDESVTSEKLE